MGANHARVLADTPGVELIAVADADPAASMAGSLAELAPQLAIPTV